MELILNASYNYLYDSVDTCNCDPYTEGCTDVDCMGEGESCVGDCRQGA